MILELLENKERYRQYGQQNDTQRHHRGISTNTSNISLVFKNKHQEALLHQTDANFNRRYTSKSGKKSKEMIFNHEDSKLKLNNEMSEALLRQRLNGNSNDRLSKIKLKLPVNLQGML